MSIILNIHEQSSHWQTYSGLKDVLDKAVQTAWQHSYNKNQCNNGKSEGQAYEVGLVLADNDYIQSLNKAYRHKDQPTNVLSFPSQEENMILDDEQELGDVIFAFETIVAEAKETNISLEDHLSHMAIHGFLHLQGYDHIENDEAEIMEQLEALILGQLGIANPYANLTKI